MAIERADFHRLMNELRVKLTGASDAGIKIEIWSVLKEFFDTSDSWLETIDVPLQVGVQDYNLVPKFGGKVIKLTGVTAGTATGSPNPAHHGIIPAFMPHFGIMHLVHPPSNSQINNQNVVFHAHVVKTLVDDTDDGVPIAPGWVLHVYYKVILDGVLGRMMMQENKSYTSPAQGATHLKLFVRGCQDAKVASQRQNTRMAQNWRYPKWGPWANSQRGYGVTSFPPEQWM